MRVAIAGGHGKIALRLSRLLSERGDEVHSLIRNPGHVDDVKATGADPVICDLESESEEDVTASVGSVDAVVFAAGAGPGSGPDRKWTMDYGGAVKLIAAARANDVARYLIVSSMGADAEAEGDDTFAVYVRAKGKADADVIASGLDYTIVRPGSLTDEPGTGRVRVGEQVGRGQIPRDDVAALIAAALREEATSRKTFEAVSGETPIEEALGRL